MHNSNHDSHDSGRPPAPSQHEARLPQIDPVTFAALSTIDLLLGKAALTRQEHAEANKSIQHLVQTIEMLQNTVRELSGAYPSFNGLNGPGVFTRPATESPAAGASANVEAVSTLPAEAAEAMFKEARARS